MELVFKKLNVEIYEKITINMQINFSCFIFKNNHLYKHWLNTKPNFQVWMSFQEGLHETQKELKLVRNLKPLWKVACLHGNFTVAAFQTMTDSTVHAQMVTFKLMQA